ncbi:hypothetical protein MtrunA17_Chr3g0130401 [Medicago truncatula]|uniref:Uncharacterized protein n=1 Tax=Medicago truncatula TaxID=3880 RepID=A0A396IW81_MEDTR|nr:hypothetical protein MtrunA17_Chr3g0130401 [Medicago truncatula]
MLLIYFLTCYQHEARSIETGASDALQVIYFTLYISAFKNLLCDVHIKFNSRRVAVFDFFF